MQRWQTFSLFALCFFQFCYRYLEIWHLLFVPHRTYTNRESDSLFLPFCTIGISMYQKSTLPYTLFLTYLPQAYSPLEHSRRTDRLTDKVLHPLFPNSFFFSTERAGPYPQAQIYWAGRTEGWMANGTRLIWGRWTRWWPQNWLGRSVWGCY